VKLNGAVNLDQLTVFCSEVWGREVDPKAAAYFARLMERRINEFTAYIPGKGKVTINYVYEAASRFFS